MPTFVQFWAIFLLAVNSLDEELISCSDRGLLLTIVTSATIDRPRGYLPEAAAIRLILTDLTRPNWDLIVPKVF